MSSLAVANAQNGGGDKQLPDALATHEDVVSKPPLFWETFKRFHNAMRTKYVIPIIGGVGLNLHVLYVEVTRRGGYEKVVSEKKWREIGNKFEFPPTTTSASFALRKNYLNLLYHYEQVYFFRMHGSVNAPTAPVSFEATGTIDWKLDCCYLVSVKLGSEVLSGVMYHPPELPSPSPTTSSVVAQPCNAIVPYDPNGASSSSSRSRRSRKRRRGGDPSRPKPNRSGYNFYFADKHLQLKSICPEREREFTKMIGESWNRLGAEEKKMYQDKGVEDKARYQRELKEYRERIMGLAQVAAAAEKEVNNAGGSLATTAAAVAAGEDEVNNGDSN